MGVLAGYLVYIAITDATERVIPARLSTLYAITGALALWTTGVEIHPFTALTMAILGVFSFAGTLLGQSGAGDHRMWFTLAILALPIAPPFALTAVLIGLAAAIAWWAIPRLFKHRSTIPLGTATAIGFAATALLSLAAG
jgi:Flp pilus assembly protein protease CpaA